MIGKFFIAETHTSHSRIDFYMHARFFTHALTDFFKMGQLFKTGKGYIQALLEMIFKIFGEMGSENQDGNLYAMFA